MRIGVEGQARITVTATVQGTLVGQMVVQPNDGGDGGVGGHGDGVNGGHDDGDVADMDMMECD